MGLSERAFAFRQARKSVYSAGFNAYPSSIVQDNRVLINYLHFVVSITTLQQVYGVDRDGQEANRHDVLSESEVISIADDSEEQETHLSLTNRATRLCDMQ